MDNVVQHQERPVRDPFDKALDRSLIVLAAMLLMAMLLLASSFYVTAEIPFITLIYFFEQDLAILVGLIALFVVLRARYASERRFPGLERLFGTFVRPRSSMFAAATLALGAIGVWLVFGRYALSMDEFWAQADGIVLASGAGLLPISPEWREYATALQPIYARITPDGWWASEYLPGNAALQYLGGPLASPVLTALAVLLAADLARRLLPEAPFAPALCALLMVTSSQVLITGMTPFAMSAHLALNLLWLWLFLQRDWRAQVAAAAVPILAVGLHQVVFFPLFAAPFLLEALLSRRRAVAVLQAFAIAASFLFWSAYDTVLYSALEVVPVTTSGGGTGTGTALLFSRFMVLLNNFSLHNIGLMAFNLVRFVTWQNVLLLPLILIAAGGFGRMPGVWRAMLGGIALTIAAMTVILAFQGYGWGYRYLHGQIGSACLLATYGFVRLCERTDNPGRIRAIMGAALAVSLLLVPLRAWQAHDFVAPYRKADAALAALDVDVVLVDTPRHAYAVDLVRNDPRLTNRPKRMTTLQLSDGQLAALCRKYTVAVFNDADAARFGLQKVDSSRSPRVLPAGCALVSYEAASAANISSKRAALLSQL